MSTNHTPLAQEIRDKDIEHKSIPGRGNGIVAGHDFATREQILFVRRPLILALENSQLQEACYSCLKSGAATVSQAGSEAVQIDLKTCAGCKTVRFCNKACQKSAWSAYHKHECKIYAKLQPRVLPSIVRGVMRLLLQRQNGLVSDTEWNQLLSLESHHDDLSTAGGDRWQNVFLMTKAIKTYSGTTESIDTILKICCIMMVNSFAFTTTTFDPIGIAIHPLPALINHSCQPNAIVRFDITSSTSFTPTPKVLHGSISVHALNPIKKGEELRITYIDATSSTTHRQHELQTRYFFKCDCPLCLSPTPFPQSDPTSPALTSAISTLNSSASKPGTLRQHLPLLRTALQSLATTAHPIHIHPYPQLRHQLILALIETGDFREAFRHNLLLVRKVEPLLYQQARHPSRLVSMWRLLRLVMQLPPRGEDDAWYFILGMRLVEELSVVVLGGDVREGLGMEKGMRKKSGKVEKEVQVVGQFEMMVHWAARECVDGGGGADWRMYMEEKGEWLKELEVREGEVMRELLEEEGKG